MSTWKISWDSVTEFVAQLGDVIQGGGSIHDNVKGRVSVALCFAVDKRFHVLLFIKFIRLLLLNICLFS